MTGRARAIVGALGMAGAVAAWLYDRKLDRQLERLYVNAQRRIVR